jgi:hypothetical protein
LPSLDGATQEIPIDGTSGDRIDNIKHQSLVLWRHIMSQHTTIVSVAEGRTGH